MAKAPLPLEARRMRTLFVSVPLMVVTGVILYKRLVLDEPQRKLPSSLTITEPTTTGTGTTTTTARTDSN